MQRLLHTLHLHKYSASVAALTSVAPNVKLARQQIPVGIEDGRHHCVCPTPSARR